MRVVSDSEPLLTDGPRVLQRDYISKPNGTNFWIAHPPPQLERYYEHANRYFTLPYRGWSQDQLDEEWDSLKREYNDLVDTKGIEQTYVLFPEQVQAVPNMSMVAQAVCRIMGVSNRYSCPRINPWSTSQRKNQTERLCKVKWIQ